MKSSTIPVPGLHRAAGVRAGSTPASCPQSAGGCAARYDRTDPADGSGGLCNVRGRDDLRTGTSKNGVIHRYYTCSTCARKGKTVCKGRSIRMDKLDGLVTDHLVERLFHPERLAASWALSQLAVPKRLKALMAASWHCSGK